MFTAPLVNGRSLLLCAATTLALAVAGCGTGGGGASSPAAGTGATASPASGYEAQQLAVGRRFSDCARRNGAPNFPDPAVQGRQLAFPGVSKQDMEAASVQAECQSILQQMPPRPAGDPVAPETLQHMRQFAQCMRQHGVTTWPDPNPNGTFPIRGTTLGAMAAYSGGPAPAPLTEARTACLQYEDEWRVEAS